jgi:Tfp pilus assembly protein PilO
MSLRTPARLGVAILAASGLVAAGGWFLLVSGQRSEASKLEQDVSAAQAALIAKRTELEAQRGIAGVAPPKVLERALPDETSLADVLDELSRVGDASGVTFSAVTPGAEVAGTGFTVTPLETQFQGNWTQISAFVSRLRKLVSFQDGRLQAAGRLYSVRKIDLAEGEGKFPDLTASMTVDVFRYTPGSAATATPATTATPAATPPAS